MLQLLKNKCMNWTDHRRGNLETHRLQCTCRPMYGLQKCIGLGPEIKGFGLEKIFERLGLGLVSVSDGGRLGGEEDSRRQMRRGRDAEGVEGM